MNIGNITSDNFNLDGNGKDIQIEVYEQLIEQLQQENRKQKEVIDKAINNSQYWIDYYTRLNSDERIALRLQENIDILKEVSE